MAEHTSPRALEMVGNERQDRGADGNTKPMGGCRYVVLQWGLAVARHSGCRGRVAERMMDPLSKKNMGWLGSIEARPYGRSADVNMSCRGLVALGKKR